MLPVIVAQRQGEFRRAVPLARGDKHRVLSGSGGGRDLADRFVGMYVNHWTLDYGEKGRESIRRFLSRAHQQGLIPRAPELEFVQ